MKKKLLALLLIGISFATHATETITIVNPYGPGHSATPAMLRIIQEANSLQREFSFQIEFKPGGNQIIAVRHMDAMPQNRLAIIAPAFVENTLKGDLNQADYVPVHALGDACWAVISNKGNEAGGIASLRGEKELNVGGVGFGNATHLTSLLAGEKYGFNPFYIVFKSNNDALINMMGGHGINFVIDRIDNYEGFKEKYKLNVLAASCSRRLDKAPHIKTLKEQGIDAPYIFNITVANRLMPADTRNRISKILDNATINVGAENITQLSGMSPPVFDKIDTVTYYNKSIARLTVLLSKFKSQIPER
jgi:tripartite-type tricarboxylate transporter receptor subunit TctC